MSSGKRKLSFLGFAPSQAEDDIVKLDEEMDRVVWGDSTTAAQTQYASRQLLEPRRDYVAPLPPSDTKDAQPSSSSSDLPIASEHCTSPGTPELMSSGTNSASPPSSDLSQQTAVLKLEPAALNEASAARRSQKSTVSSGPKGCCAIMFYNTVGRCFGRTCSALLRCAGCEGLWSTDDSASSGFSPPDPSDSEPRPDAVAGSSDQPKDESPEYISPIYTPAGSSDQLKDKTPEYISPIYPPAGSSDQLKDKTPEYISPIYPPAGSSDQLKDETPEYISPIYSPSNSYAYPTWGQSSETQEKYSVVYDHVIGKATIVKVGSPTVHVSRKSGGDRLQSILSDTTIKKLYDHNPHSVFVQLDELLATSDGDAEWKETARWIKYEEDVEEGSARWGRPHVAPLSFHSLLNLRRCLETGVVLLDLDEKDLPGVAYRVVESMVADELIEEDDKPVVMRSLLLRHRHVNDERFRFSIGSRKHASYTSLQSIWLEESGGPKDCPRCRNGSVCQRHSLVHFEQPNIADPHRRRSSYAMPVDKNGLAELRKKASVAGSEKIDLREVEYLAMQGSQDELKRGQNDAIMKRIPEGAEATTVLVGAVGFLDTPTIAFVRLAQGILMPSITEVPIPVRFMFILLGPVTAELDYHEVGRSISTLMSNPAFHGIAYKAEDRRDLLSAINEFLDDSIVLPPGNWERQALLSFEELRAKSEMIRKRKQNALEKKRAASIGGLLSEEKKALLELETGGEPPKEPPGPLERTGRLFGGVIRDIKRRYPFYISDFTDALNGQCMAATIFMYFAAVSSAITFGGLLATKTHGDIGITETLVFTCAGGILFALLAGQPMMITGATGPLLLLDESLASFCYSYGFNFLAARMYCGLWMIVIALLVASVEGSVAVKKITRFTEDIFAFLISLIFIGEPITSIINVYRAHPLGIEYAMTGYNGTDVANGTNSTSWPPPLIPPPPAPQPNTALFCTILTLSTFIIAYYLRIFRNGKFLGRSARRALGDFGVPIAIVLMVALACLVPVYTDTLKVPQGLYPTADRSWLVPLNPGLETIPPWAVFAMALPALMVYIIVFMETHIAELIIDKPERKLKKGSGFHMDIVIMSFVNCVCGMFGAPWQCVATVRSVSHVSALTVMSTTHAPGDKPHVVEVKEQRLTGLLVSLLVGISVLASGLLKMVPMAVLFGVFLYMGISALGGIQFWDRCILLLKPVKHHAQVPYVRRVPTLKMHLYTVIQIAGILVLYTVKSSSFSLALPFFLVMMVPLRMSLAFLFTPMQLRALDGAQKDIDKDDEPDFYEEAPLP